MEQHEPLTPTIAARTCSGSTLVEIVSGPARWWADRPPASGGSGLQPSPHDLLDSALASCTAMTVQMYARRKNYPLQGVQAQVRHEQSGSVYKLARRVELTGPLSEAQRSDLLRVANACPIHRALSGSFEVQTELAPVSGRPDSR